MNELAELLIRRFEGCRLSPYLCPAGVPTIGYGSTRYEDGVGVQLTDPPITHERALALLRHSVATSYQPAVLRLLGPLISEREAALVDFAYNLGPKNLQHSTLRRKILAGLWDEVPSQLMRWVRGGGKILPGLVKRRQAEAALV